MNKMVASLICSGGDKSSDGQIRKGVLNLNGQIAVCKSCTASLLKNKETCDLFLGYLPRVDHERYRADAKKAKQLHEEGYIVLDRQECVGCHFPLDKLLSAAHHSRKDIAKLSNGEKGNVVQRSWLPFKDGWESTNNEIEKFWIKHNRRVGEMITRIGQPDIWYGRMAIKNAYKFHRGESAKRGREVEFFEEPHFKVGEGQALLWRGAGLLNDQHVHRDGGLNDGFNFVEPKTNGYKLKVFRRSHHLKPWHSQDSPHVGGYGETLSLREGQICVFYTTLLHCGCSSCEKVDNFSTLEKQLKKIDQKKYESIKWFRGKTGKVALTDLSVHWTIERVGGARSEADHETGKPRVFSCRYTQRESKGDESTKSEKFRKAREEGFKRYQQMTLPGNENWVGPCGVHISDVNSSLNVFVNGKSGGGGVRGGSGRKRAHVNYRE